MEIFLPVYSVYTCRNMAESTSSSASGDYPSTSEDLSDQLPNIVERSEWSIVSTLSCLCAPALSKLSRKRKCLSNPPRGKRRRRGDSDTYIMFNEHNRLIQEYNRLIHEHNSQI